MVQVPCCSGYGALLRPLPSGLRHSVAGLLMADSSQLNTSGHYPQLKGATSPTVMPRPGGQPTLNDCQCELQTQSLDSSGTTQKVHSSSREPCRFSEVFIAITIQLTPPCSHSHFLYFSMVVNSEGTQLKSYCFLFW